MIVYTAKLNKKTGVLCLCVLAILLIAMVLFLGGGKKASSASLKNVPSMQTEIDRIAYLQSLGWEVEEAPLESVQITVPKSLDGQYAKYNELQCKQGFDLAAYRGKEVTRITYRILNHPSGEKVVADLLISNGKLIGGDVQSTALGGFMNVLSFPTDEKETAAIDSAVEGTAIATSEEQNDL